MVCRTPAPWLLLTHYEVQWGWEGLGSDPDRLQFRGSAWNVFEVLEGPGYGPLPGAFHSEASCKPSIWAGAHSGPRAPWRLWDSEECDLLCF